MEIKEKILDINCDKNFVLLRGAIDSNRYNRFFSTHIPGQDPTKSHTGETWYEVIGFADTIEEAQRKLYGRVFD